MIEILPTDLIPDLIEEEGMSFWVCSYGGSGTNMLANYLEAKGMVVKTPSWHKLLCHHSQPVSTRSAIRAIYLFGNPVPAFMSMVRRGPSHYEVNQQKLNNDLEVPISDHTLMASMIRQYQNWTGGVMCNFPILALKYETLFDAGRAALSSFLGIDTFDFPARVRRSTFGTDLGDHEGALRPFARSIESICEAPGVRLIE